MRVTLFQRITDLDFLVKVFGHTEKIVVHSPKNLPPSHRYSIVRQTFEQMSERVWDKFALGKGLVFVNDNSYRLTLSVPKETLLSKVSGFVVKPKIVPNRLEMDLAPMSMFAPVNCDNEALAIALLNEKSDVIWKNDRSSLYPPNQSVKPLFADAFSHLATVALQRHVENFSQKDNVKAENNVIISALANTTPPVYLLIHKKHQALDLYANNPSIVKEYYHKLKETWGESKVKDIQLRYGIDFERMIERNRPLTPEIVHRMNIGLSTIEIQDVECAHQRLLSLKDDANWRDADGNLSLLEYAKTKSNFPSAFWIQLSDRFLSVKDLRDYLTTENYFEIENIRQLNPETFNRLIALISLSSFAKERSYTGRQLEGFIDSAYTIDEMETYKPWVDQQELNQCCENLSGNTSWEFFAEKLAYVVCKKHLVHQNSELKYIVGALIPAPVSEDGKERWYRVTSCINSGTGNLSYTLEPACNDPSLPAIKLFRSTASDSYNLDGTASVKSDLNPINAPGYEGRALIADYEAPFFKERTVPIWVASNHLAMQKLDQAIAIIKDTEEVPSIKTLKAISKELEETMHAMSAEMVDRLKSKRMEEILSLYDHTILKALPQIGDGSWKFLSDFVEKYTKPNEKTISPEEERKDAQTIVKILNMYAKDISQDLIQELNDNIINPDAWLNERLTEYDDFNKTYLIPIKSKMATFDLALKEEVEPEVLIDILMRQANVIQQFAISRNEDISQKKQQGILCVGHSLGGALSSRTFGQYSLGSGRVPVPGKNMELYEFCAPGINAADNTTFMLKGEKHAKTLQELNKPIKIHRRYAAGDFFPLGGQVSLAAVFTRKDAATSAQWLEFDAAVQKILPTATREELFAQPYTHGIQFEPKVPYGVVVDDSKEIAKHYFDNYTQGMFNRAIDTEPNTMTALNKIWQIDKIALTLAQIERRSAVVRTLVRSEYLYKPQKVEESTHELHGEWWKYRDPKGVFAVNESGVVTSST